MRKGKEKIMEEEERESVKGKGGVERERKEESRKEEKTAELKL